MKNRINVAVSRRVATVVVVTLLAVLGLHASPSVAATTLTFAPVADAGIKAAHPNTNFGKAPSFRVDQSPAERLAMKFVVAGTADHTITTAKLRLYVVNPSTAGGHFRRIGNAWSESTITWNNVPTANAAAFASLGTVSSGTWVQVDIKPLITGDGTFSFTADTINSDGTTYSSREAAGNRPQLVLTLGAARVTKVLTFVEENHSLSQMQAGMPYLYSLSQRYAYAENYTAITHPSEPNYVALAFGSTMGDTTNHTSAQNFTGPTVFGAAIGNSHTARSYIESMPSNCSLTNAAPYAVRHNPWPYAGNERGLCAIGDVPSGSSSSGALHSDVVAGTLPNVGLVVPNLDNDAHDGTLSTADTWLQRWLPQIIASPDFQSGRLAVVVTADEDNGTATNKVLTVVLHRSLDGAHKVVTTALNHYSWTRLQTQVSRAPCIRTGCTAPDMAAAFGLPLS